MNTKDMDSAQFNALIEKAKKKDVEAVEILAKYCINAVEIHLSVKFKNSPETEDWAHDIFTYQILSKLPKYYVEYPLAWLYKIADNFVFTKLKKEKPTVELIENIADEVSFTRAVDKLMLDEAMKAFDKQTCEIFALKYIFGYSYIEIAEMLQLKPATVRKKVSRAKKIF